MTTTYHAIIDGVGEVQLTGCSTTSDAITAAHRLAFAHATRRGLQYPQCIVFVHTGDAPASYLVDSAGVGRLIYDAR